MKMLIVKSSTLTDKIHAREIDVTIEQVENWQGGMLIQDAMPNLSIADRAFIQRRMTMDDVSNFINYTIAWSDRKQSYVLVVDPDEFERLLRQLVNGEDEDGHQ
tara:strand:+ start:161 stop:472 length:312 start_codon:yes stop_codon:yes gene_type:complete